MDTHLSQRLRGRVALISGCGSAVATATARSLVERGAKVVIHQTSESAELDAVAKKMGARVVTGDATNAETASQIIQNASELFGAIDLYVFGASRVEHSPFLESTPEEWWSQVDEDLSTGFNLAHNIVPGMLEREYGRIVFVASSAGVNGWPNASAASAASAGLITLTKTMARELAPRGVWVNGIAVGKLDAPPYNKGALDGDTGQDVAHQGSSQIPIGRAGTADEIAATIAFLVSDLASGFVGQILQPNGGAVRTLA